MEKCVYLKVSTYTYYLMEQKYGHDTMTFLRSIEGK
jgi:hypothetical protein